MSGLKPASISAPAKVNLYLHVGPVRSDGRHPLDSLVVFADARAADRLHFTPSDEALFLNVSGPGMDDAMLGADEENLVLRAARLLSEKTGVTFKGALTLEKHLPIAAGIGGGSSDAAATLRILNHAFELGLSAQELMAMSVPLGGDVPACVAGEPVLMRGDGDRIEALRTLPPEFPAVLVAPPIACPTGPVFRAFDEWDGAPKFSECAPPVGLNGRAYLAALRSDYRNDLQMPAMARHPEIGDLLNRLQTFAGAEFTAMSGSGATCFALFADEQAARYAARAIRAQSPTLWVAETKLGAAGFDLSV
ncbi:4-(cytidine 5'-diphospho)-2-C-methyl-D-erythritol kinase [Ponticaulis sp.]|uniref:4-(cytidine 5'-diphospho)-2-C-methyl-D-erythritol kinase n=1 Tax=Ponticaulis sp. TaxID=2020902 RepID=UPI000B69DB8C|nr:4-(cytidine 5'-diphospho)-2-C-methyl-D-erythritol kinase [Ponticaulis sp.]MAJ08797.1 4-(cytidine 5'-diphospho)-2-C-methyl-D-erythritol kinase [Ponticaulis sp.]RPG17492.1 MAG: 4-(cytidine 5'-diphospho)-2-C-methyl-D-erythritol kinase [Hyphomonadaceae bacterium TMED125]|tara:strand:+ start:6695 stop:7615 length:921 start_codon:yes stop_codon:yes gene_type:complete